MQKQHRKHSFSSVCQLPVLTALYALFLTLQIRFLGLSGTDHIYYTGSNSFCQSINEKYGILTFLRQNDRIASWNFAGVAELADALDLGSSGLPVQVQVLSPAPRHGESFWVAVTFIFYKKSWLRYTDCRSFSEKGHTAPLLLAYKRARNAHACYQPFSDASAV